MISKPETNAEPEKQALKRRKRRGKFRFQPKSQDKKKLYGIVEKKIPVTEK